MKQDTPDPQGSLKRGYTGTFGVIQGTFGLIQGTFGLIQGTFGLIEGTFGLIQGTFGVIQGTLGNLHGAQKVYHYKSSMDVAQWLPPIISKSVGGVRSSLVVRETVLFFIRGKFPPVLLKSE